MANIIRVFLFCIAHERINELFSVELSPHVSANIKTTYTGSEITVRFGLSIKHSKSVNYGSCSDSDLFVDFIKGKTG